ncbi:MAG TPA: 23S rRNA (adenine(2030)-N(6))-methyltransferase RlmJ [Xylella sp.]
MNYSHAFHAGNHADVLKHVVLLALLDVLARKDTPFFVLDTHAGRGRYLLSGEESRNTGEAESGVIRLMAQPQCLEIIKRYLHAVQADNLPKTLGSRTSLNIRRYPGSPLLAAQACRVQDRLVFCELHPKEATALNALFTQDPRVCVHAGDGYAAVRVFLPPKVGTHRIGRGLVLIDPPYEGQDAEYPLVLNALRETLTRWPQAVCAVWYPIKQRRRLQPFFRKAKVLPVRSALIAELLVRPDDSPLRLNGSGMLLLNAPWQFDRILAPALPVLKTQLGELGANTRLEWLKEPE